MATNMATPTSIKIQNQDHESYKRQTAAKYQQSQVPLLPSFATTLKSINECVKSMPPHSTATKTLLKTPHWIQQQKQYRKDDKCDYQKQEWHKGGVSLSQSIQQMHHNNLKLFSLEYMQNRTTCGQEQWHCFIIICHGYGNLLLV